MSNQAHKNRLTAKKQRLYNENQKNVERTLRRYGASGKAYDKVYQNLAGNALLFRPGNTSNLGDSVARPVPKTVDMRHEARLRAFYEREFDKENKSRGTQSSATRVLVK